MQKMSQILFLGCGKMGSAIAKSLIRNNYDPEKITVIDPNFSGEIHGVKIYPDLAQLPQNYCADYVYLCVKPQESAEILKKFAKSSAIDKKTILISIIAGKKLKFFQEIFSNSVKIVRAMPNVAISQSQGIIAYLFSRSVKEKDQAQIIKMFKGFGEEINLKTEKKFDDFTAIFGSGPAYIFYLQEILAKIAKTLEIDDEKNQKLIKSLFLGSSLMSYNASEKFIDLRDSVSSKGGTTLAALEVMQKNDALEKLLTKAIKKASKRSKELAK